MIRRERRFYTEFRTFFLAFSFPGSPLLSSGCNCHIEWSGLHSLFLCMTVPFFIFHGLDSFEQHITYELFCRIFNILSLVFLMISLIWCRFGKKCHKMVLCSYIEAIWYWYFQTGVVNLDQVEWFLPNFFIVMLLIFPLQLIRILQEEPLRLCRYHSHHSHFSIDPWFLPTMSVSVVFV